MKKKIILILVIVAVVVGGIIMFGGKSSNEGSSDNNTNTNTNTQNNNDNNTNNNTNNEDKGNTKQESDYVKNIDEGAKKTYDEIVSKMNSEVEYFVSEYDMAGNIAEFEMFKMPEHVVSVGRMVDGIDGYIFSISFAYKDKEYGAAIDETGNYVYEEANSDETYSKDMYSDFFENQLASVIEMKETKKDDKTIITIHAILDYEGTNQYLIYNMTVNKDLLIEQEEMIVANDKFEIEDGADSALVKFHSYNAKKGTDFNHILKTIKDVEGLSYDKGTDLIKR